MADKITIVPFIDELPSHFADRLGILYTSLVDKEHKKENGQYFTSAEIAVLMGTYAEYKGDSVKILDPGCGSAILPCTLIEKLANRYSSLTNIELTAWETDLDCIQYSILKTN